MYCIHATLQVNMLHMHLLVSPVLQPLQPGSLASQQQRTVELFWCDSAAHVHLLLLLLHLLLLLLAGCY
jgi:hypothetical protein